MTEQPAITWRIVVDLRGQYGDTGRKRLELALRGAPADCCLALLVDADTGPDAIRRALIDVGHAGPITVDATEWTAAADVARTIMPPEGKEVA